MPALILIALVAFGIYACHGPSSSLTYDDGVHDGWAHTCNQLDRLSPRTVQEIRNSRICH